MPLTRNELEQLKQALGREPTSAELALFEATWSEHCSYKSTRSLLKSLPTKASHVLLGPGRDAGVIKLFPDIAVAARIESHNHPSAVDPYNGAATGVGGIVRDILSVGAKPIALLDALYLGSLTTAESRWLAKGIVAGIGDYGNRIGVPTVAGETWISASYEKQPLVNVACIGILKPSLLLPGRVEPGDVIVIAGNTTGRDGMLGSSFASKPLEENPEDIAAVQVGNPFLEKLLIDALTEAFERRLLRHVKDLGGGGLATAVAETAASSKVGAVVHLDRIHLREPDMAPEEILVSESQERMLLVPYPTKLGELLALLDSHGVEYSVIGYFTGDGKLKFIYQGKVVASLPAELAAKAPEAKREAKRPKSLEWSLPVLNVAENSLLDLAIRILSSPRLSSKRWIYEQYDWGVQGRTKQPPGYADAAVIWLRDGTQRGIVAAVAGNPRYTRLDPFRGAAHSLATAYRHVVAAGGEPLAALDNINAGNPEKPEQFWYFKEMVEGLAWAARELNTPIIGGNVSLYNEDAEGNMVDPVATIMVIGRIENVDNSLGIALKENAVLVLLGDTRDELGGSEVVETLMGRPMGRPPEPRPREELALAKVMSNIVKQGLALAAHSVGNGGALIAVAKMAAAGEVGLTLDLSAICTTCSPFAAAFSETPARIIVETRHPEKIVEIAKEEGVKATQIGIVEGETFRLVIRGKRVSEASMTRIVDAYYKGLSRSIEGW